MRYSSSVIPVIIAVYFAARLQNRIKKILPDVVKGFLTPCITLLIIVPATFLVIGPAATWMSQIVGAVTMAIYGLSPMAAGLANLPLIVTMLAASPLAETLVTRLGHRIACMIGSADSCPNPACPASR